MPGEGYLYKSASEKTLAYNFTDVPSGSRMLKSVAHKSLFKMNGVDVNSYPNTMNMTVRLCQDSMELTGNDYTLYALSGDELRGVAEFVGSNYYLTVYGEQPVDISFIAEDCSTGETFVAKEHLMFRDDVVGSRHAPFSVNIGESTGISEIGNGRWIMDYNVYDLQGRKVNSQFSTFQSQSRKGVYIVNGHKVVNGKYVNK